MDWSLILQCVGVTLGLLYLWLEYKANIWLWVVGAIMPLVHGALYLSSGIYADAAMQLYYVAAGIYGLVVWSRRPKRQGEGKIRHTPKRWVLPLMAVYAVLHVAIYFILTEFTDSRVPILDSMSTAVLIESRIGTRLSVNSVSIKYIATCSTAYTAIRGNTHRLGV